MNVCTKFQVAILKNGWVLSLWMPQNATSLRNLRGFRQFSDFLFLSVFGRSKSVLGLFCVLDENLTQKHVPIASPKLKTLNLTFFQFGPLITFIWQKVIKRLRGYLKVPQIRSMSFLGFIWNWYGCFTRRSQQGQKINFTFDPTCDVIVDVTDDIL